MPLCDGNPPKYRQDVQQGSTKPLLTSFLSNKADICDFSQHSAFAILSLNFFFPISSSLNWSFALRCRRKNFKFRLSWSFKRYARVFRVSFSVSRSLSLFKTLTENSKVNRMKQTLRSAKVSENSIENWKNKSFNINFLLKNFSLY